MSPSRTLLENSHGDIGLSNPPGLDCNGNILSMAQLRLLQTVQRPCEERDPGVKKPPALEDFRYQELDYSSCVFRLLIIHPTSSYDDSIECHLFHTSLDDQMDYSALSYCWGEDEKTSEIILNGKRFLITPNLEIALRDLRRFGRDNATDIASIWIDAICIDQNNNAERSHQVGHMDSIYSRAERTIVWFGPIRDGIQFNTIWALHELRGASEATVFKSRDNIAERYGMSWSNQGRSSLELSVRIVQDIFAHPWWSRTWVAQEIGLAKRVIALIGARSILWSDVRGAIKNLLACCELVEWARTSKGRCLSWETTIFHNVQRAAVLAGLGPGEGRKNRQRLYELLLDFQSQQTSNLRDRVYGLMGLATDYRTLDFKPDYSTPLHMVSRMAMRNLLLQNQNLLPLTLAMSTERDAYRGAASWGLRLSHRSQPKNSLAALRNQFAAENQKWAPLQKLRFHAGELNKSPLIDFSTDFQHLTITGYGVDTILVIGSNLELGAKNQTEARIKWLPILRLKQYLPIFSGWLQDPKDVSTLKPPSGWSPINPTMEGYHQPQNIPMKQPQNRDPLLEVFETTFCLGMLSPTCSEKDIHQRIDTTLQSHRIAITANNLVVLVPIEAQPNDMICIFPGGDIPLVLRKVRSKNPVREYDKNAFFSALHSNRIGKFKGDLGLNEMNWGFKTLESLKGNDEDDFHLVGEVYCKTRLSTPLLQYTF
jgi:hypothetical protein